MSKSIKISDDYLNAFKFGFKFFILLSALSIPPIIGTTVGVLIHQIFVKIPALYVSELKVLEMRTSPFSKEVLTQYNGSVEQIIEFEKRRAPRDLLDDLGVLDKPPSDAIPKAQSTIDFQPLRDQKFFVLLNRKVKDESEKNELERDIANILTDSETHRIIWDDKSLGISYVISNWRKTIIYGHLTVGGWILFEIIIFFIVIICLALYFPIFKAFSNLFKYKKIIK